MKNVKIIIPKKKQFRPGVREGLAKTLSYSFGYPIDSKKILYQFHGKIPELDKKILIKRWTTGISSASLSVGFINYIYFSVYNTFMESPFAGVLAALSVIFIKVPIYNSIKIMQSARFHNMYNSLVYLKNNKGLYTGTFITLAEDAIELDIKNRLYNKFKKDNFVLNVLVGTLSSAFASAVTTPFDNIRIQMLNKKPLAICYQNISFRVFSNITKNLSFFILLNVLTKYFD